MTAGPGTGGRLAIEAALDALEAPLRRSEETFSSDLSIDEAVLLSEVGYEPRAFVMGSAVYHVGFQYTPGSAGGVELVKLSSALAAAREEAVSRLVEDGRRAGADGVVGVRVELSGFGARHPLVEFTAVGTAVAATGRRPARFFTSALSGKEFYLLRRAGWEIAGLVMGSCVMQVGFRGVFATTGRPNQELEAPTRALYSARELAMERLQREAEGLDASGVVGVRVSEHSHSWGQAAIELFVLGTAIRATSGGHRTLDVAPVVLLDDATVATDPAALRGGG